MLKWIKEANSLPKAKSPGFAAANKAVAAVLASGGSSSKKKKRTYNKYTPLQSAVGHVHRRICS